MKLWRGIVHRDVKFLVLVLRSLKEVQVQQKVLWIGDDSADAAHELHAAGMVAEQAVWDENQIAI